MSPQAAADAPHSSPPKRPRLLERVRATRLVAGLLYGSGLRLMEACRLRVKDVDLWRREILVRDGKGRKDRLTVLPADLCGPLKAHLDSVRRQHDLDLADGAGSVSLPDALDRKYLRAPWEWGWQWVFPRPASTGTDAPAADAATTFMNQWSNVRSGMPYEPPT